jgi:transposase
MRAYSVDLRQRVLAALDRGMSRAEAVTTFAVSLATIKRWVARQRAGLSLAPGRSSGRSLALGDAELLSLLTQLEATPDATLDRHLECWNAQHPERTISRATLDRAIRRLDWSRKKRRSAPVNETKQRVRPFASN